MGAASGRSSQRLSGPKRLPAQAASSGNLRRLGRVVLDLVMASPIQLASVDGKSGDGEDLDGFDSEISQHLIDDPVEATGHSALRDLDRGVIFVGLTTSGGEVDLLPQLGCQPVTSDVLDISAGTVSQRKTTPLVVMNGC